MVRYNGRLFDFANLNRYRIYIAAACGVLTAVIGTLAVVSRSWSLATADLQKYDRCKKAGVVTGQVKWEGRSGGERQTYRSVIGVKRPVWLQAK